jgi:hypothetical protein
MPERAGLAHSSNSLMYLEIAASIGGLQMKCQGASASELVPCQFAGTDEKHVWRGWLSEENT